jgi:hypothetical protein
MQAHPFTQNGLLVCAVAVAASLAAAPAHADVFTWTDASGRLNMSNVEPPRDVHAQRIVQKALPKRASKPAAAAQASEVEALKERVAELEAEVDRARAISAAPPAPVVVVPPVVVAPPPQPPAPAVAYAPPPEVAPCDPLAFGCPAFGYPVNIVVVRTPRFHRFRHTHGERPHAVPARPNFGMHRR